MSIFTLAIVAHAFYPFITLFILIGLFYLLQLVIYRAGINWIEIRARWQNQELDYQQRRFALTMSKQNLLSSRIKE